MSLPSRAMTIEGKELIEAVTSNGFSVAVAAFLLLRMEKELRALRKTIKRLRHCQVCKFSEFDKESGEGKP